MPFNHLLYDSFICCGIRDANILLRMFASIIVEHCSVTFCFCNVGSALGIKVVLARLAWVKKYSFCFEPLKEIWRTNVIYPLNLLVKFSSEPCKEGY